MKPFIILFLLFAICSCHKSQTGKPELNCGCETDSILNVAVDSVGWLSFDSASKIYLIHDTVEHGFLNIYWICNPEIKDISSINLPNNSAVAVYYSGKVKMRCLDSIITLPEVFLYNLTVDSLKEK
jgi:hypothetical protein